MSDAIVLTSQQPGDPRRAPRSSAPRAEGAPGPGESPAVSLVPAGFRFEGTVAFDGAARLDGAITGRVEGRGRLEVGPEGRLEGDVRADECVVAGAIEGDLVVAERLELHAGARVRGAVSTPTLRMHEGAILDGPCRISARSEDADS